MTELADRLKPFPSGAFDPPQVVIHKRRGHPHIIRRIDRVAARRMPRLLTLHRAIGVEGRERFGVCRGCKLLVCNGLCRDSGLPSVGLQRVLRRVDWCCRITHKTGLTPFRNRFVSPRNQPTGSVLSRRAHRPALQWEGWVAPPFERRMSRTSRRNAQVLSPPRREDINEDINETEDINGTGPILFGTLVATVGRGV